MENREQMEAVVRRMVNDLDRMYGDLQTREQQDASRAAMVRLTKLVGELKNG